MATEKQRRAARKRAADTGRSYSQSLSDVTADPTMIALYLSTAEIASCDTSSNSYDSGSGSSYDSGSSSSSYDSGSSSYDSGSSY